MTDIVKRTDDGVVGELRVPRWAMQHARAELAQMQRRGEIARVHNPREERNAETREIEWVVNYVRLADPPPAAQRHVRIAVAVLGGLAGIGAMIYHARYVIGAFLLTVILAAAAFAALGAIVKALGSLGRRGGHCPGAWHR